MLRMIERGVNSPLTSSMGRLFDSVAAITGVADDARYEGEAAILLEAAADPDAAGTYEFGISAAGRRWFVHRESATAHPRPERRYSRRFSMMSQLRYLWG